MSDIVDLSVEAFEHETQKAVLVRFHDGEQIWIPLAVCQVDRQDMTVTVEQWWIEKNEIDVTDYRQEKEPML